MKHIVLCLFFCGVFSPFVLADDEKLPEPDDKKAKWLVLFDGSSTKEFGTKGKAPILFQDHGTEVWYRNIRIRDPR